ncbi:hypothetical protein FDECE_7978 [Fusarium decemcellulare]|nr:hypothetical protein FDECE_7978 [Fusarium decemcellulare]
MLDDDSYLSTFVPPTQRALAPRPRLDAINSTAVLDIANSLAEPSAKGPTTVKLFPWVRREMSRATTESMYGPMNPIRDSSLQTAWYAFEPHIMVHMLKACPSILARESLHVREQLLIPAFGRYFANSRHLQGSLLVQCRYKHNHYHGLRGRDVAATENGQMVASLTNSVVGAFWMIYYIFSNPDVMSECREEVEILVITDRSGRPIVDFEVRRPGTKPLNPTAFRSFGGGKILCLGRHFVSTEVMAFAALLLLRFDLNPIAKGKIPVIEWPGIGKNLPMASSIPTPKDEIRVEFVKFVPRDGRDWLVRFSSSSKGVDIVAEDVK